MTYEDYMLQYIRGTCSQNSETRTKFADLMDSIEESFQENNEAAKASIEVVRMFSLADCSKILLTLSSLISIIAKQQEIIDVITPFHGTLEILLMKYPRFKGENFEDYIDRVNKKLKGDN